MKKTTRLTVMNRLKRAVGLSKRQPTAPTPEDVTSLLPMESSMPQSPLEINSSKPNTYSLEVECHLDISTTRSLSLKQLGGHIKEHLSAYRGELAMFKIHHALLCMSLRLLKYAHQPSNMTYPHLYRATITTVVTFSSRSPIDRHLRAGLQNLRASWNSLGIGYKTKWLFTSSIKRTSVVGLPFSVTLLPDLIKIIEESHLKDNYVIEEGLIVLV